MFGALPPEKVGGGRAAERGMGIGHRAVQEGVSSWLRTRASRKGVVQRGNPQRTMAHRRGNPEVQGSQCGGGGIVARVLVPRSFDQSLAFAFFWQPTNSGKVASRGSSLCSTSFPRALTSSPTQTRSVRTSADCGALLLERSPEGASSECALWVRSSARRRAQRSSAISRRGRTLMASGGRPSSSPCPCATERTEGRLGSTFGAKYLVAIGERTTPSRWRPSRPRPRGWLRPPWSARLSSTPWSARCGAEAPRRRRQVVELMCLDGFYGAPQQRGVRAPRLRHSLLRSRARHM